MDTIENSKGQLISCVGPEAVNAFRLRTLIIGLRFEAKTGMKMSGRVNLKKVAKAETGLKTNDVNKLITSLQIKLTAQIEKCMVVTDGV